MLKKKINKQRDQAFFYFQPYLQIVSYTSEMDRIDCGLEATFCDALCFTKLHICKRYCCTYSLRQIFLTPSGPQESPKKRIHTFSLRSSGHITTATSEISQGLPVIGHITACTGLCEHVQYSKATQLILPSCMPHVAY